MLMRIGRIALLMVLGILAWNLFVKPETRRQFRGHVELIAKVLLAASAAMLVWHFGFGGAIT